MDKPVLDLHLHLVALDPADTDGGWFSRTRLGHPVFRWIRRAAGLPGHDSGFDAAFRDGLRAALLDADASALQGGFSGFRAVGLAMDCPRRDDGEEMRDVADFFVSDAYAFRLAGGKDRLPGLLPGVSIHPYRPEALRLLADARANGAVLVKWLPTSQGIDPADVRAREFAESCRRLGMPLLVHTGSEAATRNAHPRWNNPRALIPLLDTGAVVVAAHSGMRSLPHEPCHFREWIAMLRDWPTLYGDTAALFGLRPRKLLRALGERLVAERLVHGSDWPVPNWPGWYWPGLSLASIVRLARIRNPLWRDVATKRAAGVPEETFVRGWRLFGFER